MLFQMLYAFEGKQKLHLTEIGTSEKPGHRFKHLQTASQKEKNVKITFI